MTLPSPHTYALHSPCNQSFCLSRPRAQVVHTKLFIRTRDETPENARAVARMDLCAHRAATLISIWGMITQSFKVQREASVSCDVGILSCYAGMWCIWNTTQHNMGNCRPSLSAERWSIPTCCRLFLSPFMCTHLTMGLGHKPQTNLLLSDKYMRSKRACQYVTKQCVAESFGDVVSFGFFIWISSFFLNLVDHFYLWCLHKHEVLFMRVKYVQISHIYLLTPQLLLSL